MLASIANVRADLMISQARHSLSDTELLDTSRLSLGTRFGRFQDAWIKTCVAHYEAAVLYEQLSGLSDAELRLSSRGRTRLGSLRNERAPAGGNLTGAWRQSPVRETVWEACDRPVDDAAALNQQQDKAELIHRLVHSCFQASRLPACAS